MPVLCLTASVQGDATRRLTVAANDAVLQLGTAREDGVPILVRLSASVPGFSYADVAEGGANLFFTDESGERLPHEIDTWNTAGESLVWVRVPRLTGSTKLYAWYGGSAVASNAADVWKDFAGVWHMNEKGVAGTVVKDSTAHQLHASSYRSAQATDGILGGAWTITQEKGAGDKVGCLEVPDSAELNVAPVFTASGWVRRATDDYNWSYLLSRKTNDGTDVWGIQFASGGEADRLRLWYAGNAGGYEYWGRTQIDGNYAPWFNPKTKFLKGSWCKFDVVYTRNDEEYLGYVYIDGERLGDVAHFRHAPHDLARSLVIGGGRNLQMLVGDMDEVRLCRGELSAQRLRLDYAMQTDAAAFVVDDVRAPAPLFAAPSFRLADDGTVIVSSRLLDGSARVAVRLGGQTFSAGADAVPENGDFEIALLGVTAASAVTCELVATDEKGAVLTTRAASVAGMVSVAAAGTANEDGLVPGAFTVTRSAVTDEALVIAYTVGGSAVPGDTYVALSGTVTIPAGAASATIPVTPLWSPVVSPVDTAVELSLTGGDYIISGGQARVRIVNKASAVSEAARYRHCVRLALGYSADTPVADVAVPVRFGESLIPGFSYADFLSEDYSDLAFLDAEGVPLSHEIEKLDPNGESVAWVRFPELRKGTVIYLVYGSRNPHVPDPAAIWTDYVGVWHLSDPGAAFSDAAIRDSSANRLHGRSEAAACSTTGVLGGAWQTLPRDGTDAERGLVRIPANPAMDCQGVFTVSGWIRHAKFNREWNYLVSRKGSNDNGVGWGVQYAGWDRTDRIRLWYDSNVDGKQMIGYGADGNAPWFNQNLFFNQGEWTKFEFVYFYDETAQAYRASYYLDGERRGTTEPFDYQPKDGELDLTLTDIGDYDEVRFFKGVRTPEQIAAEYAAEASPGYITYGAACDIARREGGFTVFIR